MCFRYYVKYVAFEFCPCIQLWALLQDLLDKTNEWLGTTLTRASELQLVIDPQLLSPRDET